MKKFRLTWVVLLFGLFSCTKESSKNEPNIPTETKGESKVALSLDASFPIDELRTLKYQVAPLDEGGIGAKRVETLEEKPLYSICAISNEAGTKTYYFDLVWQKTPGQNHFFVKEANKIDIDKALTEPTDNTKPIGLFPPNLTPEERAREKWFISGLLTYDESKIDKRAKTISYSPNKSTLKAMAQGVDEVEMDIPLYFDWVPLKVTADGMGVSSKFEGTPEADRIKMKPLGVMMRVEVTNVNTYPVKVKGLRIFSTVINPSEGKIKFGGHTKAKTPADLPYESQITNEDYSFDVPDFPLEGRQRYDKYFLVWGMPTKPNPASTAYYKGRKFSQFLLDVEFTDTRVSEEDRPKMSTLYVWGSDKNAPRHNSRAKIDARIIRPQMVLEYYSNGYATQARGFSPNRPLYQITKENYRREKSLYPGWRGLKYLESDILGQGTLAGNMGRNPNAPGYRETLNLSYPDKVGPDYRDESARIFRNGVTEKLYSLRFDDKIRDNIPNPPVNRYQYSAWRYTRDIGNRYGAIESIYLGPAFKGFLVDVMNEEFWRVHQADIVRRTYSSAQTDYVVNSSTSRAKLWDLPDGQQYLNDIETYKKRGEILYSHIDEDYVRTTSPGTGKRVPHFTIGEHPNNGNYWTAISYTGPDGDRRDIESFTFCKSRPYGTQCVAPKTVWETAPFIMYMVNPRYTWK